MPTTFRINKPLTSCSSLGSTYREDGFWFIKQKHIKIDLHTPCQTHSILWWDVIAVNLLQVSCLHQLQPQLVKRGQRSHHIHLFVFFCKFIHRLLIFHFSLLSLCQPMKSEVSKSRLQAFHPNLTTQHGNNWTLHSNGLNLSFSKTYFSSAMSSSSSSSLSTRRFSRYVRRDCFLKSGI